MLYIGIDPGLQGAVALLDKNNLEVLKVPLITNNKGKNEYDINALAQILRLATLKHKGQVGVVLESVHAMPGQGVTSMFSMGRGLGIWEGLIVALGIPYSKIAPQTWQKAILKDLKKAGDGKQASMLYAQRMFPNTRFMPTERCKKTDNNMTDATCLALYAKTIF